MFAGFLVILIGRFLMTDLLKVIQIGHTLAENIKTHDTNHAHLKAEALYASYTNIKNRIDYDSSFGFKSNNEKEIERNRRYFTCLIDIVKTLGKTNSPF